MAIKKKKKHRRSFNLNFILWGTFSTFIIVFVTVIAIIQQVLLRRQYLEQMEKDMGSAQSILHETFENPYLSSTAAWHAINSVQMRYNVTVQMLPIVDEKDWNPDYEELYREIEARVVIQNGGAPYFTEDNRYACVNVVFYGQEPYYCYLSSSLQSMTQVSSDMLRLTVVMGLFALALAFVASGFVSMLITKPVSEVTKKAKELACGNYDVQFDDEYSVMEMNELSKVMNYASSEISKADTMQKELIANVSHDFKTPLTMIKAYASMIQEISGNDPVKREKHTQVIIDEADRLTALVGDLLDLSKLRAGIETEESTVFNLSSLLYGVVGRFDYYVETQGFTIIEEISDDIYTRAGRGRVEQVLYNLIGNAINYTGENKTVRVRLENRNGVARFEVIDSGKGIAKEEIDTIWERYYRATDTHKRPVRGTGLGLSIVKNILIRYGIRFGVLSEIGQGSCFWVDFPLAESEEGA